MKICMVTDPYYPYPGGVAEHVHHLTLELRKLGHRVIVLTGSQNKEGEPDVIQMGKLVSFPANLASITFTFHWRLPFLVWHFFRENSFDIVHAHGPLGFNLPYFAVHYAVAPCVGTFHTVYVGYNFYALAKMLLKDDFRKLKGVIVVSKAAKNNIAPHFPGYYRIIPNGVDVERFNPKVPPIPEFTSSNPKILFVGRLEPRKGLQHLLAAFPFIKKELPNVELIVVGTGPQAQKYQKIAEHELGGAVKFVGYVTPKDLPSYYRSCDVYCSPAVGGEAFGIVLLEAMASGTPVVASNIEGYKEVVRDGYNGLLANPLDPRATASAIVKVLKDRALRRKLQENGRSFAESYSWRNVAKQVEQFYLELLNKHNKSDARL
ncbi:MAG TPA: glycosyltransferase family 1 protein [bacterium (Candidatus Stahlbacteria)]|nr:glycosyltransferase family 1 protein [Candidatus Stahlbacteria bacterium]